MPDYSSIGRWTQDLDSDSFDKLIGIERSLTHSLPDPVYSIDEHTEVSEEEGTTDLAFGVRFRHQLQTAFRLEPVENGIRHEAESIIDEALKGTESITVLDSFRAGIIEDSPAGFAASILLCLGRRNDLGTAAWRADLIKASLKSDDVEVRDAAAQAAEFWSDRTIRSVLQEHAEPEGWLAEYINDIIGDLPE
ncbi:MAG: hypothetical protein OXF41_08460 [bacterium]|nr:hypothetical protein [bacterium]